MSTVSSSCEVGNNKRGEPSLGRQPLAEFRVTPSRILKLYYAATFAVGILLTIPLAYWVDIQEVGVRGSIIMTLCWNVLFVMLLPMVMDWGERHYFKARFMQIEEVAGTNPELASVIDAQCKKLHIFGCRFAVVNSANTELFSYGVWGRNPRLVISQSFLSAAEKAKIIPSIEAELHRFRRTEPTLVFFCFAAVQIIFQYLLRLTF